MHKPGSPYMDYSSAEAGPSYYRDGREPRYSSYEDSYDPPAAPSRRRRDRDSSELLHRRGRNGLSRSRESLDGRHRSFERLDGDDSYEEQGIENRGLQVCVVIL